MPRTRSLAWSELKIGISAVVAIALAAVLIVAVGGETGFSWQRYDLKTTFDNVNGLKGGAVVRVAGVEVGKVTDVDFVGPAVQVTLSLRKEMQSRVTSDSRASIGSLSLLGEPVIDITPASTGSPLKNGDVIQSSKPGAQISDVTSTANDALGRANALLGDIRAGRGTVGKLFTDDELYREFNAFVASANELTGAINHGKGTLGKLTNDPQMYNELSRAAANLEEMTRRINAGEGSLGQLLKDDRLAKSLDSATASFAQVGTRLNTSDNTVGKLLTEKALYDRLNSTVAHLDQLTDNLDHGQGTAGQLLHDTQLYDNMNSAANELKQLIADIRKNPRKFLNVKVSVF
ncbi:MAG TPA: MlaD family protein [Vicinamibacterales bacterium]|jgi:phospholipid/cholesterol/gamma-HCH transport system substrate-binding protein